MSVNVRLCKFFFVLGVIVSVFEVQFFLYQKLAVFLNCRLMFQPNRVCALLSSAHLVDLFNDDRDRHNRYGVARDCGIDFASASNRDHYENNFLQKIIVFKKIQKISKNREFF